MALKLLLADDGVAIQKVIEIVLSGEGFEVKSVNNGEEALAIIPSFIPDIILADVEMPLLNGYQLCEKIKLAPETRHMPVILLSGAFEIFEEDTAKRAGADEHIIKPFEPQELISKVKAVLERKKASDLPHIETDVAAQSADGGLKEEFQAIKNPVLPETAGKASENTETVRQPEPWIETPSKEDFAGIFRKTVDDRISLAISALDIKDLLFSSVASQIKDSTEQLIKEFTPEFIEKAAKDAIQNLLAPLSKELERIIWETVPALAEILIAKEIEKIKSEI